MRKVDFINEEKPKKSNKELAENFEELGRPLSESEFHAMIPQKVKEVRAANPFSNHVYKVEVETAQLPPIERRNNDVYFGQWNKQRVMEGKGICIKPKENLVLEGTWEKGIMTRGRIYSPTGAYYEGEIKSDIPNGSGTSKNPELTYEGSWLNGKKHGQGILKYSDGFTLEGTFENGEATKGKLLWVDGSSFEGELIKMKIGSKGLYKSANGDSYDGSWKEGVYDGEGTYTWANGEQYKGHYSKGLRQGSGKYSFTKAECFFDGSWSQGKPCLGTYSTENKVIKASWRNGSILTIFSTAVINPLAQNEPTKPNIPTQNEVSTRNLLHLDKFLENYNQSVNLANVKHAEFDKVLFGKIIKVDSREENVNKNENSQNPTSLELNQVVNLKQESTKNIPIDNEFTNMSSHLTIENKLDQAPSQVSQPTTIANGTAKK